MSATEFSDNRNRADRRVQFIWILAVFLVVVALDQTTKAMITYAIPLDRYVPAERWDHDFFFLTHQRNPGLVGGMFGADHLRWVAFTAPVLATLILLYLLRHLDPASRWQALAFGLIAGGAIGNLIDRFFRVGGVVDFLQFNFYFVPFDFPWKRYPAFNVADSAICVGVFLLLVSWRGQAPKEHTADASRSV